MTRKRRRRKRRRRKSKFITDNHIESGTLQSKTSQNDILQAQVQGLKVKVSMLTKLDTIMDELGVTMEAVMANTANVNHKNPTIQRIRYTFIFKVQEGQTMPKTASQTTAQFHAALSSCGIKSGPGQQLEACTAAWKTFMTAHRAEATHTISVVHTRTLRVHTCTHT